MFTLHSLTRYLLLFNPFPCGFLYTGGLFRALHICEQTAPIHHWWRFVVSILCWTNWSAFVCTQWHGEICSKFICNSRFKRRLSSHTRAWGKDNTRHWTCAKYVCANVGQVKKGFCIHACDVLMWYVCICVLRAHRGLNVQINGVQVEGAIGIGYLYIYQHVWVFWVCACCVVPSCFSLLQCVLVLASTVVDVWCRYQRWPWKI